MKYFLISFIFVIILYIFFNHADKGHPWGNGKAPESFTGTENYLDDTDEDSSLKTSEVWIDEGDEVIGGTYIIKYGWDFTSRATGKRYIGGKDRGEWICQKNLRAVSEK